MGSVRAGARKGKQSVLFGTPFQVCGAVCGQPLGAAGSWGLGQVSCGPGAVQAVPWAAPGLTDLCESSELHSSGKGSAVQLQGWPLVRTLLEPAQVVCTYPLRSSPLDFLALFASLALVFGCFVYLLTVGSYPSSKISVSGGGDATRILWMKKYSTKIDL